MRLLSALMFVAITLTAAPALAADSCQFARDNECDESRFGGGGACEAGTDATDCALLATGILNDSCTSARNGACEEPRYRNQSNACVDGSDTTDCAAFDAARLDSFNSLMALVPADIQGALGDNSCIYAFDGECDDLALGGTGYCNPRTDAADCRAQAMGGEDSCEFAKDGECDEVRAGGTGSCADWTDATDCNGGATPSAVLSPAPSTDAANSCEYANDNECDEGRYNGTGVCDDGTDTNDCRMMAVGQTDDSCSSARDGQCDEPRYNTGSTLCTDGTDASDCSGYVAQREADFAALLAILPPDLQRQLGDNTCRYAYDNECDDSAFGGQGYCGAGTDAADCRAVAAGGDNSCAYANDNECDEPRFDGTGACTDGTDTNDCAAITADAQAQYDALLALLPSDVRSQLGNDSCQYANDGECDDINFGGTGVCDAGTDAADCRALAAGGEDSCQYANDNECDEPGIGTGACTSGTDVSDCSTVAYLRNRDDTCDSAFDGVCNEPGTGDGTCAVYSDTADCIGRNRPAGLRDHFFGRDDRFLPQTEAMPWRAIGILNFDEHVCTGTLVGPHLVLTAAHCVTEDAIKTMIPDTFSAGAMHGGDFGTARGIAVYFDPAYSPDTVDPGTGNGHDWALVTLDRDLGNYVGMLEIHVLTEAELSQIKRSGLLVDQAGYSWDTGDNLSGNEGCRLTMAYDDNSVMHQCDTAYGDSGSPFLLQVDGTWQVIAVDSQYFDPEDKHGAFAQGNLAVDSRAFADAVTAALADN